MSALWAEFLKARRSKVPLFSLIGFLILPCMAGLFMLVLKNPDQARRMGLISTKARLSAGVADWPTFLGMLTQGTALGGAFLFAIITAWVFGREFSDRTLKDLLALPTSRAQIVAAKFALIMLWILVLVTCMWSVGLGIGALVAIPGWSVVLAGVSFWATMRVALLTCMLMPFVALWASVGRGYLPALGWAFLTLVLAQIAAALGWGDWLPWSVPALLSGIAEPAIPQLGLHSYLVLCVTCMLGTGATWLWWRDADHVR